MSRRHFQDRHNLQPPQALATMPKSSDAVVTVASSAPLPDARSNKPHLICPLCGNNPEYRGRGKRKWQRQINGPLQARCYKCDTCGTEWVAEVRAEVEDDIEYKTTKTTEIRPTEEGEKAAAVT